MKKLILSIAFILFITANTNAQHCVFDGSNIVLLKLVNKNGKPWPVTGSNIKIVQDIFNEDYHKDTTGICCTIEKTLQFDSCKKVLLQTDNSIWNNYASKRKDLQKLSTIPNCYALILFDSEIECLFDKCNTDGFVIAKYIFGKNRQTYSIKITRKDIFPLCESFTASKNIKPITVSLKLKLYFEGH
jgi:hypothetical protein